MGYFNCFKGEEVLAGKSISLLFYYDWYHCVNVKPKKPDHFVFFLFDLGEVIDVEEQLGGDGRRFLQASDDPVALVNKLFAELVLTDAANVQALNLVSRSQNFFTYSVLNQRNYTVCI